VLLGTYYFGAGRLKEAAVQLQKGVQLDPQNRTAYYDLGLVKMQLGQLDEAQSDLEKALSIEQDPNTYRALGSLLVLQGKYKEAIEMDKKSIDLRPGDYHTWGNLGGAYLWASGGREQSINAYRKAIELAEAQRLKSPDDANLLVELADDYASTGQVERSGVLVRKALALSPDDPHVNYRAGETYEIIGQRAKAIPLIAKALALGYHATEFQRSPELASLRDDPAFQDALNKAKSENAVDSAKKLN
jgi:serine/threonine-protein kinase